MSDTLTPDDFAVTEEDAPTLAELGSPYFSGKMPGRPLVYVAAPYSHEHPEVVAGRMHAFDAAIARLLLEGECFPISPLMNHAIIGRHNIPGDWTFWQNYSRRLLARCDEVLVLDLPGWAESAGVTGEIELARSLSMEVRWFPFDHAAFAEGYGRKLAEPFGLEMSHGLRAMQNAHNDRITAQGFLKRWSETLHRPPTMGPDEDAH